MQKKHCKHPAFLDTSLHKTCFWLWYTAKGSVLGSFGWDLCSSQHLRTPISTIDGLNSNQSNNPSLGWSENGHMARQPANSCNNNVANVLFFTWKILHLSFMDSFTPLLRGFPASHVHRSIPQITLGPSPWATSTPASPLSPRRRRRGPNRYEGNPTCPGCGEL